MNSKEWSKEIFSRNLRYYMEQSKLSQKELASIAGVSAPTLNEWLSKKKYPRIDKIQKLADHFGVLKSDLIEEKAFSESEKMLFLFNKLSPDQQAAAKSYMEYLLNSQDT